MTRDHWTRRYLEGMTGRHIASEQHVRIQVLEIKPGSRDPWAVDRGSLLITVISGHCHVRANEKQATLGPGEQWLLDEGDLVAVTRANQEEEAIVQYLWAPGFSGPPIPLEELRRRWNAPQDR